MKRILVTGGAGFISSHTADLLLQENYEVVVYDNLLTGKLSNVDLFNSRVQFLQADILDFSKLAKEVARCDAVVHLAALASVPKSIEDPIESLKINSLGFLHVLQAIRQAGRPVRLVYASSAAVYGDTEKLPCSDEIPLVEEALSPYALEKANDERYAELFARLFGIKSLGLRYFNVYGPRQDPKSPYSGVIAKFLECYKKGDFISVFGDGKQSRDFIHVSDVARANLLALRSDYCGALNIATGKAETLLNLISYIEQAGGKSAEIVYAPARAGDIANSYAKVEKAKKELDFRAAISLAEGIKNM
jgi:nucleoside-diphosphate-sugar epimerase